jgi:hypothetical protein
MCRVRHKDGVLNIEGTYMPYERQVLEIDYDQKDTKKLPY